VAHRPIDYRYDDYDDILDFTIWKTFYIVLWCYDVMMSYVFWILWCALVLAFAVWRTHAPLLTWATTVRCPRGCWLVFPLAVHATRMLETEGKHSSPPSYSRCNAGMSIKLDEMQPAWPSYPSLKVAWSFMEATSARHVFYSERRVDMNDHECNYHRSWHSQKAWDDALLS